MGSATGLGLLDLAVLEACEAAGATSTGPCVRTRDILEVCHDRTGIGPRPAHEALCEMVRPWVLHLPLIDFVGNYGSNEDPPASPRYTESRLTLMGAAALAAERGELGPLPIGLINGDTHVDGRRPPLDPARTVEAIGAATGSASDAELVAIVGQPSFPIGCVVALDNTAAFAAGRETEVRLSARITTGPDQITISHLPPDCSAHETSQLIEWHVAWQRHGSGGHDSDRHGVHRPGVHRPGPAGPPSGIRAVRDEPERAS